MKRHEPLDTQEEEAMINTLRQQRVSAPADFASRVLKALPEKPSLTLRELLLSFWPSEGRWLLPAMAGAAASVALISLLMLSGHPVDSSRGITVTFELQAPDAQTVELTGSFNNWKTGQILLKGPDATGHWTASVSLPPGQHEYLFLVDGKNWVTDPQALARRPDGFGHENALLDL